MGVRVFGWALGLVELVLAAVVWGMLGHVGWARLLVVVGLVWGLWCRCRLVVGTQGLVGCTWGKKVEACAHGGMLAVGCRGRVGLVRRV